jgi:hypothetical protein
MQRNEITFLRNKRANHDQKPREKSKNRGKKAKNAGKKCWSRALTLEVGRKATQET